MRNQQRAHTPAAGENPVIAWRAQRLCDVGFSRELAERVAADREYDVHALLELVDRGCPPDLAARILAPIESERRSP
jgi:hypothetical protein